MRFVPAFPDRPGPSQVIQIMQSYEVPREEIL